MLHILSDTFPKIAKHIIKDLKLGNYEDKTEVNNGIKNIHYYNSLPSRNKIGNKY